MTKICSCGSPVGDARVAAGLDCCLVCGDLAARREITAMRSRVFQTHNKGGFSVASKASYRSTMLDSGRKDTALAFEHATAVSRKAVSVVNKPKKRPIGCMWMPNGDCLAIFDRSDERIARSSRHVFYA